MRLLVEGKPVLIRGKEYKQAEEETHFNEQQIEKLSAKYNQLLTSRSGELSKFEFVSCLGKEIDDFFGERIFSAFDEDDSGTLSMVQFIKAIAFLIPGAPIDYKVRFLFNVIDYDKDGIIRRRDWDEMCAHSLEINHIKIKQRHFVRACKNSWKKLAQNSKEKIDFEEFSHQVITNKVYYSLIDNLVVDVNWIKEPHWSWPKVRPEQSVHDFFAEIVHAESLENPEIYKWNSVLKSHCFNTVDHLKDCTQQGWIHMNLPLRLYNLVTGKLLETHKKVQMSHKSVRSLLLQEKSNRDRDPNSLKKKAIFSLKLRYRNIILISLYLIVLTLFMLYQTFYWCVNEPHVLITNLLGPNLCVSRVAAGALIANMTFIFLFVLHRSLGLLRRTFISSFITFDISEKCHEFLGKSTLLFAIIHTIGHVFNFHMLLVMSPSELRIIAGIDGTHLPNIPDAPPALYFHYGTWAGITGWIMNLSLIIMTVTSLQSFRETKFNTFIHFHHLYLVIFICGVIHGLQEILHEAVLWKFMTPGFVLFGIEKIWAVWKRQRLLRVIGVEHLPGCMLMKFEKPPGFNYEVGNFVYVQVPEISRFQWHPFTLTSSPHEDTLSIHIRILGDWCQKLQQQFNPHWKSEVGKDESKIASRLMSKWTKANSDSQLSASTNALRKDGLASHSYQNNQEIHVNIELESSIRIDGPIVTQCADLQKFKYVMFIAGGIGVTPMVSMLKLLQHRMKRKQKFNIFKVYFYWTARSQSDFDWFKELLLEMSEDEEFLDVNIFLTSRNSRDIRNFGLNLLLGESDRSDLITGLHCKTVIGRPDFPQILKQVRESHPGHEIGVFFCGSARLGDKLAKLCLQSSNASDGTKFIMKREIF